MTMDALAWTTDVDDDASERLLNDIFTLLEDEEHTPTPTPVLVSPALAADDGSSLDSTSDGSSSPVPRRKRPNAKYQLPIKRTLDALRDETKQLTQTLHRLRHNTLSSATECALTERFKRRRAELECEQLRDAVFAQTQFLRGLQSVFAAPPAITSGLSFSRHLHNYTKLPRERSVRWHEYAALSQETRLRRAIDFIRRETQALACGDRPPQRLTAAPRIECEVVHDATGFSVTSMSLYAVETRDLGAVLRGACVAVRDIVQRCSSYECTILERQIVDPDAASSSAAHMLYHVMRHKSVRADSDALSIESRSVTLYQQSDDDAIVLWDYVDDDALHPTKATTDITRQAIGACLIRRELCDDGVERSVCRILNTRCYRFHAHGSQATLGKFKELSIANNRENELLFRGILLDSIASEEAAYARVVGRET